MSSVSVRRRPNAFNLLYQMELLVRLGRDPEQNLQALVLFDVVPRMCQAWNARSEIMQAYSVGKTEASAALQLLKHVPKAVRCELARLVQRPGLEWKTHSIPTLCAEP